MISETNQTGQTIAEYIYLADQLLSMIKPREAVYYFHNDHLGTPQVLTDDSQVIAWKAVYTPFGEAVPSIQTIENPFRFPGQYYDPETGLHYNYFRCYNPQTGRYITPDPIGLEGGINLYVYVENQPLNWIDPLGLWGFGIIGSESTEAGVVIAGAGQTGSIGGGVFAEGFFKNINLGGFKSWGGLLGGPGYGYSTGDDKKGNFIFGAYGGGGGGLFITNAKKASDLCGTSKTFSFNIGWGVRVLSIQLTVSKEGTWLFSYGGPLPGVPVTGGGYGGSVSIYNTKTWATK